MVKILVWIGVIIVVLLGLRLLNFAKARQRDDASRRAPPSPPAEAMVRCVRCGVYLPSHDAKPSPGGPICGDPGCTLRRRGDS